MAEEGFGEGRIIEFICWLRSYYKTSCKGKEVTLGVEGGLREGAIRDTLVRGTTSWTYLGCSLRVIKSLRRVGCQSPGRLWRSNAVSSHMLGRARHKILLCSIWEEFNPLANIRS